MGKFKNITGKTSMFMLACMLMCCIAFGQKYNSNSLQAQFNKLHAKQIVVVLTKSPDSFQGKLYCFQRSGQGWKKYTGNAMVVGKNGIAKAPGLIALNFLSGPYKKEGDGKSPAGIFRIGTAFGYAPKDSARWMRVPYVQATNNLLCVDDSNSAHYNHLVNKDSLNTDWNSFEWMHRTDDDYKWGLFVEYNYPRSVAGCGSCIFIHIWANESTGTVGCTAMDEKKLLKILHWVDCSKNPILVQMTEDGYKQLRKMIRLPEID